MRVFPLCVVIALGVGCGARPLPPRSAPAIAPAPLPPAPWSRFAEVAAWPAVGEPFPNRGHWGEGALAIVRVSADARPAYEGLVADSALPEGAVVALFHSDTRGPGRVFVMEKEAGKWRFRALTPGGVVVAGGDAACRGCHAGAVGDSLFGLPRGIPAGLRP